MSVDFENQHTAHYHYSSSNCYHPTRQVLPITMLFTKYFSIFFAVMVGSAVAAAVPAAAPA
jgi:hypothetical protein